MALLSDGTTLEILGTPPIEVGEISSIGEFGFGEADEVDVTPLKTDGGYKEFIQGLKDTGTLTISGFKEAADQGQARLRELHASGAVTAFRIAYPDHSAATFRAFVKKFNFAEAAVSGALSWTVDLRVSGRPTYVEGDGTLGVLTVSMAAAGAGQGKVTIEGNRTNRLVYRTAADAAKPAYLEDAADWPGLPISGVVTATAGDKLCVAEVNALGQALAACEPLAVTVGA